MGLAGVQTNSEVAVNGRIFLFSNFKLLNIQNG